MKKVYYLSTCSTCNKIISELGELLNGYLLQDIKTSPITEDQLEEMKALTGSFEALFSRRAMKYKSMGLAERQLTESDYKQLIIEEYTFLKRPVFLVSNEIFVGNSKKNIELLRKKLES